MSFSGPGGSKESIPVIMQGGSSSAPKKSGGGKWVTILVLAVVVIAAIVIINQQMNGTKKTAQGGEQVATTTSQPSNTPTPTPTTASTPATTPATTGASSPAPVEITGLPILDVNGKTLIGLRAVLEADGWLVDWSNATGEARCKKDGQQSISVKPGLRSVQVGASSKALDVVPVMRNDHILVSPVWLKELTNSRLSFDSSAKKATISK